MSRQAVTQIYTSTGKLVTDTEIADAKSELGEELSKLRDTVKLKDTEITKLKQEIANLQTHVQIESLKTELANLKNLASQQKTKRKTKKN